MRGVFPIVLVLPAILAATPRAEGQYLPRQVVTAGLPAYPQADTSRSGSNDGGAMLGALVGGAVGLVAVGYGVYYLSGGGRICGDDPCGLWYGLLGALAGEAVGIGLGAHLGNGRRGNAAAPIAASLGVLLLAGLIGDVDGLPPGAVVFVPIAQIAAAVLTEVSIGRARGRR